MATPIVPLVAVAVGLGAMVAFGRKKAKASPAETKAEMAAMPEPVREATEKVVQSGDATELAKAANTLEKAGFTKTAEAVKQKAKELPVATADMPYALRKELGEALQKLRIQPDGSFKPPVAATSIQVATALSGKLTRLGFKQAGTKLRALAQQAARLVPSPPPSSQVDVPGLSQEMRVRISRALQLERDPVVLKSLVQALQQVPASAERDKLSEAIEALITSVVAKQSTDSALRAADAVMKAPAAAVAPATAVLQTPAGRLAQQAAASLLKVQQRYGMPRAKRKEDRALIKRFQAAAGQTADGLAGPSTVLAMAKNGVGRLPLVMYWARGSNRATVRRYTAQLNAMADAAEQAGQSQRAQELRQSAAREKGQAGVIQVGALAAG